MSKVITGFCHGCNQTFDGWLMASGNTAYAYCDRCGAVGFMSGWREDIPAEACFRAQGPISPETESLLEPCLCGGRFRRDSGPRCPRCRQEISAAAAKPWLEAQAGRIGWTWQESWQGADALGVKYLPRELQWLPTARKTPTSVPTKDEILAGLRAQWPDRDVLAGHDCESCGRYGDQYDYDDDDDAERLLREVAEVPGGRRGRHDGHLSLRDCPSCGALFEREAGSYTAADNLFAARWTRLRRITPAAAIQLLE